MKKKILWLAVLASASSIMEASAAPGWGTFGPYSAGTYQYKVKEYREDVTVANSIFPDCMAKNPELVRAAPIVIFFPGAHGAYDSTSADYPEITRIAQKLHVACARMLVVVGVTPYAAGTINPYQTIDAFLPSTRNVEAATDYIMRNYSSASSVTYVGGSSSALFGAKLLELRRGEIFSPASSSPWTKLKRFILAGPGAGDMYFACRNAGTGSHIEISSLPGAVGEYLPNGNKSTCVNYTNFVESSPNSSGMGAFYSPLTAVEKNAMAAGNGPKINMFVGAKDHIYGKYNPDKTDNINCAATAPSGVCWSAVDGASNYASMLGLTPTRISEGNSSITRSGSTTLLSMANAGHSDVWAHASMPKWICGLVTGDSVCFGPSRGVIDSRQGNYINGWACALGDSDSKKLRLYAGGPIGVGTLVNATYSYYANQPSEAAVASACGSSGMAHRFKIAITLAARQQYAGQKIYIYGANSSNQYGGDPLVNSGSFVIPAP